jgi:hypothetical protein
MKTTHTTPQVRKAADDVKSKGSAGGSALRRQGRADYFAARQRCIDGYEEYRIVMKVLKSKLKLDVAALEALYRQIEPAYGMAKCPV